MRQQSGYTFHLLPYLMEEGKKNIAGFFVDNRNLRIFKDPLPGKVKQHRGFATIGATKTIVERCQDYTQTIAAVLSKVSPKNKGATL